LFYLDSSAWVKRYVQELGSPWVHTLFTRRERMATSILGHLEVVAALVRRLPPNLALLESRLAADWQDLVRLPLTGAILDLAVDLARQYRLRGADAIHLATALDLQKTLASINDAVVLLASDGELLRGAQAAGLQVENPLTAVLP
jgi:uncharacterized protein